LGKKITIIVPIYNSSAFMANLMEAIDAERKNSNWDLEVVLIDDGSKDKSFEKIVELSKTYTYIKGIKLSRNFGHQIAVKTGLSHCTGDYIAVIDDDLQDPPSLLPKFFKYLDDGYDVAYGVRKKRKENIFKKISYNSFYRILKQLSDTDIPLDSGDFCVMKKQVVDNMLKLQEKNPFLRGIRAWVGFKQIGVEYERAARFDGQSGYTFKKLMKIAMDGIFSFSSVPIRTITWLGFIGLVFALVYSALVIYQSIVDHIDVKGFATLAIIILFFGSLTLICLGIIGEYIVRIYDEVRNRPYTVIERTINL
jgi:polyisoprenyl-phosphate glycosyltransferase